MTKSRSNADHGHGAGSPNAPAPAFLFNRREGAPQQPPAPIYRLETRTNGQTEEDLSLSKQTLRGGFLEGLGLDRVRVVAEWQQAERRPATGEVCTGRPWPWREGVDAARHPKGGQARAGPKVAELPRKLAGFLGRNQALTSA